ncbi:UDP-N-acetylmuramate dehydrogenase [Candidatus Peregrinibacteria bacterium]|jgi:UDP-N-acetylmuramate dehydrogenase|nr:UDP-N-acetylmuramate dehydrogenase [Candidatus Peregrinibacteria bacterium]MBT4056276.1 UDP-N-acetylmuramate dehydrogenase [Candidatus Peregrinibacteria bacterium]
MNKKTKKQLTELFPKTKFLEPLSSHSTFRIGGQADAFIELKDLAVLKDFLKFCKQNSLPYHVIGGGSNILFHDKGFRGLIIKLTAKQIDIKKNTLTAEAGASLSLAVVKAEKQGYKNLTPLKGIPGTIGGAIRGNAGARGLEIKDILTHAEILNPTTGRITKASPQTLKMTYRHTALKGTPKIVLKATIKLSKRKPKLGADPISWRLQNQPGGHSAGSFFKNPAPTSTHPQPLSAGYLIDQCGLKGHTIGKAKISDKHANFFQNLGGATQKDVLALAKLAKQKVYTRFKIRLEEEVQAIPQK